MSQIFKWDEVHGAERQENYLKNAEMMMEDDYNSLDGMINNGKRNEAEERASVLDKLKEVTQQSEALVQMAKQKEELER